MLSSLRVQCCAVDSFLLNCLPIETAPAAIQVAAGAFCHSLSERHVAQDAQNLVHVLDEILLNVHFGQQAAQAQEAPVGAARHRAIDDVARLAVAGVEEGGGVHLRDALGDARRQVLPLGLDDGKHGGGDGQHRRRARHQEVAEAVKALRCVHAELGPGEDGDAMRALLPQFDEQWGDDHFRACFFRSQAAHDR